MPSLDVALGPGLVIHLRSFPADLLDPITAFLAYFLEANVSPGPGDEPLVIEFRRRERPAAAELVAEREELRVFKQGAGLFFELPGASGWCDVLAGRGGIDLEPDASRAPERVVTQLLVPLLFELAATRGWLGLHAAAVALGDRGLLLPGPSGCGKSTIFSACRRQGFDALSDDLTWLTTGVGGAILLYPFPRGAPYGPSPAPTVGSVTLERIVYPSRTAVGQSRVRDVEGEESLGLLAAQAGLLTLAPAQAQRFRLLARASQLPARRLEMADGDLTGAPGLLAAMLEDGVRSAGSPTPRSQA